MSHTTELPMDLEQCHALLLQKDATIAQMEGTITEQDQTISRLQQQIQRYNDQIHGKKSERFDPNQPSLFDPSEFEEPEPEQEAPAPTEKKCKPRRHSHGRNRLPEHLPRIRVEYGIVEEELTCPCCQCQREKITEVVSEQLERQPASFYVLESARFTYACKKCQEQIVTAPKPPQIIEKCLAGPGLLATIIVDKYSSHLPLYRLEEIFSREGIFISRSTTCSWMAGCAEKLRPLADLMKDRILQSRFISTDETPVRMNQKKTGVRTSRMWIYVGDRNHPYVVYDSTLTRSGDGPQKFLGDYKGYLQSDAYSGYSPLYAQGVTYVGCWAHARRKFYEQRHNEPILAHEALGQIQQLYLLERPWKDCTEEERRVHRQKESVPLLDRFYEWLKRHRHSVTPKSGLGGALGYVLNSWEGLKRYTEQGYLNLDNNVSERGIRPIAIGRKNWIMFGSEKGGQTAAVLFSLIASCRHNGADPLAYLKDVLERFPTCRTEDLVQFLPDRWIQEHPEAVWIRRMERANRRAS